MTDYEASCHCGKVIVTFSSDLDIGGLGCRACDCSFCTRIGGVWTSDPGGHADIYEGIEGAFKLYRFGTETADFISCALCGITVAAVDGDRAVLNTRAFSKRDEFLKLAKPMSLEGEILTDRQERRQARWTPVTLHSFN